jgi:uncharacterized membrane protein YhaH (DUF805 family)
MDFWSAVKSVFGQYATFTGRACRSEYWYFTLFNAIVIFVVDMIDHFLLDTGLLAGIWSLVTLIPVLAVGVRRLHDIDRSGWWYLLVFVPIIGWVVLLIWACTRGTLGPNRFGSDPLPAAGPAYAA